MSPAPSTPPAWTADLVHDEAGLQALRPAWDALLARQPQASVFQRWDFIRLAWMHSARPQDRLLVVVMREGDAVRAIAPLCRRPVRYLGLPIRQIEWIGAWEGDRPTLLCEGDPAPAWSCLARWLTRTYLDWDVLRLQEQPPDAEVAPALAQACAVHRQPDGVGYTIDIAAALPAAPGMTQPMAQDAVRDETPVISHWHRPGDMDTALARFIGVERTERATMGRSGPGHFESLRSFYAAWLQSLAARGDAEIWTLADPGGAGVAASMVFRHGPVRYERAMLAAGPSPSPAPDETLRRHGLGRWREEGCRTLDLLGADPSRDPAGITPAQARKAAQATHRRETVAVLCVRRRGRMFLPWTAMQTLRSALRH